MHVQAMFRASKLATKKHRLKLRGSEAKQAKASVTLQQSCPSSSRTPVFLHTQVSTPPPSTLTVVLIEFVDKGAHPIIPQLDNAIVQAGEDPRPLGVKAKPCQGTEMWQRSLRALGSPKARSSPGGAVRPVARPTPLRSGTPGAGGSSRHGLPRSPGAPRTARARSRYYLSPGPT